METYKRWGYRRDAAGLVEGKIFDVPAASGALPVGWVPSPSDLDGTDIKPSPAKHTIPTQPQTKEVADPGHLRIRDLAPALDRPDEQSDESIDDLRERAEALGITVDGRWKERKLKAMIEAAESSDGDESS